MKIEFFSVKPKKFQEITFFTALSRAIDRYDRYTDYVVELEVGAVETVKKS